MRREGGATDKVGRNRGKQPEIYMKGLSSISHHEELRFDEQPSRDKFASGLK